MGGPGNGDAVAQRAGQIAREVQVEDGLACPWIDDRLARDWSLGPSKQVLPPRSPMRPPRPLRPNQRLFMPAFRYPLEDVFQGIRRPLTAIPSILQLQQLPSLGGAG